MFKKSTVVGVVSGLNAMYASEFKKFVEGRGASFIEQSADGDFESVFASVTELKGLIESVAQGCFYEGVGVSNFLSSLTGYDTGGKLSEIELTVKSKLKAVYPYRLTKRIAINENTVKNMCDVYNEALIQLIYIDYANANIDGLNEFVSTACEGVDIPYSVKFALGDKFVSEISDTSVVFGIGLGNALELSELPYFVCGNEFNDYVASSAKDKFVEALKAIQTTPQLIKANVELIVNATGVKTKRRADKLIRASYHKQAKYFGDSKASIGYFDETVKIGGEDTEVFAIVEKVDDAITCVLKPFDVKTNLVVDFDVISAVKKSLAK